MERLLLWIITFHNDRIVKSSRWISVVNDIQYTYMIRSRFRKLRPKKYLEKRSKTFEDNFISFFLLEKNVHSAEFQFIRCKNRKFICFAQVWPISGRVMPDLAVPGRTRSRIESSTVYTQMKLPSLRSVVTNFI